ncbi:putative undecaprenyl-phosphate N-acetylglucosaminyl 1-phosphate transferase [mine drainage metagenome]|uniref:Putative undecaprenyl-phosphate N-acetylglucosaminyl 1-phosphate transferase n=1 Tax=mine drainage metagenome TaxID=410659 RepID=A0A1J5QZJ4_9ZZZZ
MHLSYLNYLLAFAASFGIVVSATPLFRTLALSRGILDGPDGPDGRKRQIQPIPYLGGLAIAIGFTVVVIGGAVTLRPLSANGWLAAGVILPALGLGIIGLLDDLRGLGVRSRFAAQTMAAIITATISISLGTSASLFGNRYLDSIVTIFWVIGITNAINLLDNMDGLAGGSVAISALGFFAIAALNGQYLVAALSVALTGACLGFLWHNWNPATIYMGDSGALFLGFMLAVIAVRLHFPSHSHLSAFVARILILALPIVDTSIVVVSRLWRGVSPFQGGRDHLSHRLANRGYSVTSSVLILFGLAALSTLAGVIGGVNLFGVGW